MGQALAAELAELFLEAVDVAAGEIVGLLDDPVAREAPLERAEPLVEMGDLVRAQPGELLEAMDAELVELDGQLGADALQLEQVVRLARLAGKRAVRIDPE